MRKSLITAVAVLATLSALPVSAAVPQQNRDRDQHQSQNHRNDNQRQNQNGDARYGTWQSNWGARLSAPPRHFTRHNDWYRHVRACQQRYRSYNPATDTFIARPGVRQVCRL